MNKVIKVILREIPTYLKAVHLSMTTFVAATLDDLEMFDKCVDAWVVDSELSPDDLQLAAKRLQVLGVAIQSRIDR